jgi:hypothetical protein
MMKFMIVEPSRIASLVDLCQLVDVSFKDLNREYS